MTLKISPAQHDSKQQNSIDGYSTKRSNISESLRAGLEELLGERIGGISLYLLSVERACVWGVQRDVLLETEGQVGLRDW